MFVARILPPSEWAKLAETEVSDTWPQLPDSACVVAVEDAGVLVGCHVLFLVLHAEGLWIHPDYRKRSSVARRLWAAVQAEVVERFGVGAFQTAAIDDDVRRLLAHVGAFRLPGDQYLVPVKGRS